MTELEKKVFREVFVGKAVRFDNKEQLDNIKRFYKEFNVGNLGYEYIGSIMGIGGLIKLNDNLKAYYLADIIYEMKYTFDFLLQEYKEILRGRKMAEDYLGPAIPYHRRISGVREEYKPLPNKIAFRNDTTTLVYDTFKVVRAKASNKDEAIRETGLLVALLKALNVKDYNTIIANAWDTENELTRHFYLYGVVQQLYVDKKLLSRNQFNKLFEAVGDKKPNVNIGGEIIEVEYK